MITADTHSHTCFSHGINTPFEMHAAATKRGLKFLGFSEHSPRPAGYDYSNEYREILATHLKDYVSQVKKVQENSRSNPDACQALFGMEMDWLDGQDDFIVRAVKSYDFDYLIGSVHFLDHWGFDDNAKNWDGLSQEECEKFYLQYFDSWEEMIMSGLFQIAAHPDLVKIFSVGQFHVWLNKDRAQKKIKACLKSLKNQGMAMEISSAGLRKACGEFYPAPLLVSMAHELGVPIALASDAHNTQDVGYAFDDLAGYAHSFGYQQQAIWSVGKMRFLPF